MKGNSLLVLLILLTGCLSNQSAEISVPDFQSNFYQEALLKIEERIAEDPSNFKLVEQQLHYCEMAGWPFACIEALESYSAEKGMSKELYQSHFDCYISNDRYQDIVNLSDNWRDTYPPSPTQLKALINSLIILNKRLDALVELRIFLAKNDDLIANEFAAQQYLALGDSLLSVYYLSKVYKEDSSRHTMLDYGKLLFKLGYSERATEVLEEYYLTQESNQELSLDLALFYDQKGYYELARRKLRKSATSDSIKFYMASLYQKDLLFDSAILCLDAILLNDSSNFKATKRKADLYNQKGWLTTSLKYYEQAFALDVSDTTVSNQIASIQRKMAYLQRRKFEENKAPILQLESKKSINE